MLDLSGNLKLLIGFCFASLPSIPIVTLEAAVAGCVTPGCIAGATSPCPTDLVDPAKELSWLDGGPTQPFVKLALTQCKVGVAHIALFLGRGPCGSGNRRRRDWDHPPAGCARGLHDVESGRPLLDLDAQDCTFPGNQQELGKMTDAGY